MNPPFTARQFLEVFARYNDGVWPAPAVLYLLAGALLLLAAGRWRHSDRWASGILAFLWGWMGFVYHWSYFASINPAAWLFGALFLVQSGLFLVAGAFDDRLAFRLRPDAAGVTGAALVVYALVAYPVLGALAGHGYPDGPTFGLPCPTVIVTFGLLLWAERRVPLWLLVIPAAWAAVGAVAALRLGMVEDVGLLVAGVVGTAGVLVRNRRLRGPATATRAVVA